MTTSNDEHLSALVDDEAGDFERRRLLDEIASNPSARERWGRYHLIGEALRGGLPARTDMSFAARIGAALDSEEALHVDPSSWARASEARPANARATRPVLGFALAASVAAVTVLGVQALLGDREGPNTRLAESAYPNIERAPVAEGTATVVAEEASAPLGPWASTADEAVRLNSYLVTHSEHAAIQGMLPQVRVVGYASEQE